MTPTHMTAHAHSHLRVHQFTHENSKQRAANFGIWLQIGGVSSGSRKRHRLPENRHQFVLITVLPLYHCYNNDGISIAGKESRRELNWNNKFILSSCPQCDVNRTRLWPTRAVNAFPMAKKWACLQSKAQMMDVSSANHHLRHFYLSRN